MNYGLVPTGAQPCCSPTEPTGVSCLGPRLPVLAPEATPSPDSASSATGGPTTLDDAVSGPGASIQGLSPSSAECSTCHRFAHHELGKRAQFWAPEERRNENSGHADPVVALGEGGEKSFDLEARVP